MEAAVAARKLTNVRFLGHRADLAAVMKGAWLFIHFPLRETFGLVVIEAMAAGVPVLARRVGGIPDILSGLEATSLYEVNASPTCLAADIIALADDPRRLEDLAGEQYRAVCSRFDKPAFIRTMTDLYQRLLSAPSRPT
jgi:glycosyltransferase involved in cell wall biosynthesis